MGRHRRAGPGALLGPSAVSGSLSPPVSGARSPPTPLAWTALLWTALLTTVLQAHRASAAPASHAECAALVPLEEVVRGKGAFLSGCVTLSETYLGGCWTQEENEATIGCQTCNIQEDAFSAAVFPAVFPDELDPCPSALDYTTFYEGEYGPLSVVTAASLTSTGCPEGWLYSADTEHCYFKSPNTAKAADQADAVSKCQAEGAWVIAINSEAENDFLLHNLLFTGFFGETYTGMVKPTASSKWAWPEESSQIAYDCTEDYSNWLEGPTEGCGSTFNGGEEGSCMEIFPYEPKGWNPFSCIVGKHFVCEMPAAAGGTIGATLAPAPTTKPTGAPSPAAAPTPAPTAATPVPTGAPSTRAPSPAPTLEMSATPAPTTAPSAGDTGQRELAPSSSSGDWAGGNLFSIAKRLVWLDATYSLYLREGDVETAVVTGKTKDGLGTATDAYDVKDGCYRLAVTSTGDPTALTWTVTGGDPFGAGADGTGEGLDGGLFTVGGGVCDAGECQSRCLSDIFGGDDPEELATGTCDGYSALIAGACSDACPDDDQVGLQQKCVQAGCTPELACGLDIDGGDGLSSEYEVGVKALVEVPATTPTSSAAGAGDAGDEFEMAVALWLVVDPTDVLVTAVDGVDVQEEEEDAAARRRLGIDAQGGADNSRALQADSSTSSETSSFTRYEARVRPASLTLAEAKGLQETAAADGAAGELQDWLRESGGSWQGASVASLEGQVVEEFSVEPSTSEGVVDGGDTAVEAPDSDDGGALGNPLLIGGIAAGAVVVAGLLLLALCRSRSKKKQQQQRKRKRRGSLGPRSQDLEGGDDSRHLQRGSGDSDGAVVMPLYKDDGDQLRFGGNPSSSAREAGGGKGKAKSNSNSNSNSRRPSLSSNRSSRRPSLSSLRGVGSGTTAAVADAVVDDDDDDGLSPAGGSVFVPLELGGQGQEEPMSAATVAHQQRQQQRQRQHQRQQQRRQVPGDGGGGGGADRSREHNRAGSSSSSPDGSPYSGDSDAATTAAMSLSAQESVSGGGAATAASSAPTAPAPPQQQQQHRKAKSSVHLFKGGGVQGGGVQVKDSDTLETKRPSVRGPSGALASLGFARGLTLDVDEEEGGSWPSDSNGGGETVRREGSGSLYDGGSEAGSRYYGGGESGGSALGSGGRAEGFSTSKQSANARIRELQDRQGRDLSPVTLKPSLMALPSPAPFSPGTDLALAQALAPSPRGAAAYQETSVRGDDPTPAGRRRSHMVNPSSGIVPDRKAKARRASRRRGGGQEGRGGGGGVSDPEGGAPPPAAAVRPSRPPVSGGVGRGGGGRGGAGMLTPGPQSRGRVPTPGPHEDSECGSRFYGSSGDERLTPGAGEAGAGAAAGGGREGRMPAPSPLSMAHNRFGGGAISK